VKYAARRRNSRVLKACTIITMVLRRRRLCYVIVCMCMLDVTSSRDVTSLSVGERRQPSRDHTSRRRYDDDRQQQDRPAIKTDQALKTKRRPAAEPRCRPNSTQSSCLMSSHPEVDLFLNAATSGRATLNTSSQQPAENSLTASRIIQVTDMIQSSNKKVHKGPISKSSKQTSRFSFRKPSFHRSHLHLLSVLGAMPDQVGAYYEAFGWHRESWELGSLAILY